MPLSDYEIVIGLEVHAELCTESKLFCGCSTAFGAEPNSHVCPVCLGLPGVLPVLNKRAVELTVKAGLALNCRISDFSKFDRKQYFYPDLPKAYQISQYQMPLCQDGWIEIPSSEGAEGETKRVRINRVHLEEEAGKSVHSGSGILSSKYSMEDYNRCGIPLIEIVSEPDMRSTQEARAYLDRLKSLLMYVRVSDCKMEEGSLRCDVNISLRRRGESRYGVRAEIKNLNSFKAVESVLDYEAQRQAEALDAGEVLVEQTRTWNEAEGVTVFMRPKEGSSDYRYFPEPDLVPVVIPREDVERLRAELPEMPWAKRERYIRELAIPPYDADLISSSRELADYFDAAVAAYKGSAKTVSNWVMGELSRLLNQERVEFSEVKVGPEQLAELLSLIDSGVVSLSMAKAVFEEMFMTGKAASKIVEEKGLRQISDTSEIEGIVDSVLAANLKAVEDVRSGNEKAIGFLVGQTMKVTKGKANPQVVSGILRRKLGLE